jgi:hypothetical protein
LYWALAKCCSAGFRKPAAIGLVDALSSSFWYTLPHCIRWLSRPFKPDFVGRTLATGARDATIMCFSAGASFSVAAATAVVGIAALRHVEHPREFLLAIVPLLFAFQQTVEGLLWLQLSAETGSGSVLALSLIFLILAEVLWPIYSALAVLLIEPDQYRRRILSVIATAGSFLSIYLLQGLISEPPIATIQGDSIAYASNVNPLSWQQIPYLVCTCVPLLISSHRIIQILAPMALAGFVVSVSVYLATFVSVWCFFAAANSTLIYFYFRRTAMSARHRLTH